MKALNTAKVWTWVCSLVMRFNAFEAFNIPGVNFEWGRDQVCCFVLTENMRMEKRFLGKLLLADSLLGRKGQRTISFWTVPEVSAGVSCYMSTNPLCSGLVVVCSSVLCWTWKFLVLLFGGPLFYTRKTFFSFLCNTIHSRCSRLKVFSVILFQTWRSSLLLQGRTTNPLNPCLLILFQAGDEVSRSWFCRALPPCSILDMRLCILVKNQLFFSWFLSLFCSWHKVYPPSLCRATNQPCPRPEFLLFCSWHKVSPSRTGPQTDPVVPEVSSSVAGIRFLPLITGLQTDPFLPEEAEQAAVQQPGDAVREDGHPVPVVPPVWPEPHQGLVQLDHRRALRL